MSGVWVAGGPNHPLADIYMLHDNSIILRSQGNREIR